MRTLDGMSVIITGGGSGIGAGTARYLAAKGALVTISGRRQDKLRTVADSIGERCCWARGDITRADDRQRLLEVALAHGGSVGALINNAGNLVRGPITELDERALIELFHTNVVAAMMLTGLVVPYLEMQEGAVVFIGSVHTRRAFPGASPYAATKGAIEALAGVLAAELGPKQIRVGCVVPGAIPTELYLRAGLPDEGRHRARMDALAPLHALGRIGTEQEVAEAIEYLVRAEWSTGTSVVIDGGLSLGVTNY